MEFPSGATCSLTMSAFTRVEQRRTQLMGTHGFIDGDGHTLRVVDFRDGSEETIDTLTGSGASEDDGHGGGDEELTAAFLTAVATGDPSPLLSTAGQSLATHRVVWAAEEARTTGRVVRLAPLDASAAPS